METKGEIAAQTDSSSIIQIATTSGAAVTPSNPFPIYISPNTNIEGVGDIAIGTTEVQIAITGTTKYIRIQADTSNTGIIFIGKTGVLSDGSNDFIRLESGDEVSISYDDSTNALYAISNIAAQTINVGALL